MLLGSKRGPKDRRWKKACRSAFEDFFARRSEPLHEAETDEAPLVEATGAGLKWLFSCLSWDLVFGYVPPHACETETLKKAAQFSPAAHAALSPARHAPSGSAVSSHENL